MMGFPKPLVSILKDYPSGLPSWWRARIHLIREELAILNDRKARAVGKARTKAVEKEIRKLRKGYTSAAFTQQDLLAYWEAEHPKLSQFASQGLPLADDSSPLTLTELTTFGTWFAMHSARILGEEYPTSSREFPIRVRGDKKVIQQKMNTFFDSRKRLDLIREEIEKRNLKQS